MPRDIQLALFTLDDRPVPRLRKATKAHRPKQLPEQIRLELKEKRFLPVIDVPRSRAECPTERPCKHVRCEWNTMTIMACDRAGRPGLSHVPRDESGKTLPMEGDAGDELAGTTLRPVWLGYGWTAKGYLERGDDGSIVGVEFVDGNSGPHLGRWEAMQVEDGEVLEVWHEEQGMVAHVRVKHEGDDVHLFFDRPITNAITVEFRRKGEQPSCGLDVIERARGPSSTMDVARAMGRSPSWVRKLVRKVLVKLRSEGVSQEEIAALLGGER